MKRLLPPLALALAVLVAAGAVLLWPSTRGAPTGPTETRSSLTPGAARERSVRAVAVRAPTPGTGETDGAATQVFVEREPTAEQVVKRALLAEQDAAAQENRRKLFQANIASIDAALATAEANGGNPEYVAALRQRRALLEERAAAEAAERKPGAANVVGAGGI